MGWTQPDVGYSAAQGLMLVPEEAVEIRVLRRQDKRIRGIARVLGVSRNTVRRYARQEGLPHYEREARPSKLGPYKQYLQERVKAAAPDWIPVTVLLRELRALGYPGGYSILKEHLAKLRSVGKPEALAVKAQNRHIISVRNGQSLPAQPVQKGDCHVRPLRRSSL